MTSQTIAAVSAAARSANRGAAASAIPPGARTRLIVIDDDASIAEAVAALDARKADFLVVRDAGLALAGVVTKSDVLREITDWRNYDPATPVSAMMTRAVVMCRADDILRDVWRVMKRRGLRNIPVVDPDMRPIGVLNARDALDRLREDSGHEELLLGDCVMGVGYR